jgi:phosphate acetyltransferase
VTIFSDAMARAVGLRSRVVFVEGTDERILRAARQLADLGIARPLLLGDPAATRDAAERATVELDGIEVLDADDDGLVERHLAAFQEVCADYSDKLLRRKIRVPLNHGAIMLRIGEVEALAAGVVHSTGDVILAGQQFVGLAEGTTTVSSVGFLELPAVAGEARTFAFADCAVTVDPDPSTLADIALTTAQTASTLLGWEPRVAMLSYSTDGSGEGASVDKVREAVAIARSRRPDIAVDGEFQLDPAILPRAAASKVRRVSAVAGQANILVFPDLDAGNIAVKCAMLFGSATNYGPLLQGFAKPIADFSRSATVEDIVGSVTLRLLGAQR